MSTEVGRRPQRFLRVRIETKGQKLEFEECFREVKRLKSEAEAGAVSGAP